MRRQRDPDARTQGRLQGVMKSYEIASTANSSIALSSSTNAVSFSSARAQRWQGTLSKAQSSSAIASFSFRLPDHVAQMSHRVDKRRRVNFPAQTTDETLDEFHGVLMFALPHALA